MLRAPCGRFVFSLSRYLVLAAVVSAGVSIPARAADERAAIMAALEKESSAEFLETPLNDVVSFLRDVSKVNIRVNRKSLEEAGVGLDAPCTLRLNQVTLRSVLNRVVAEYQIRWIVRPWGIELVSEDTMQTQVNTKIRDVSDLAPPETKLDRTHDRLEFVMELIDALKLAATPAVGWADDGGVGRIAIDRSGNLVVTTTDDDQQQLDKLLADIRNAQRYPADKLRLAAGGATSFPALSQSEQRLTKVLQQPTTIEFIDTPFNEVVAFLMSQHKIPMLLDRRALEASGIGVDARITESVRNLSLRETLQLICEPLGLTFIIRDELLLLTTREECERAPELRVYPLGDFAPTNDRELVVELLGELIGMVQEHCGAPTPGWEDDGGIGRIKLLPIAKSFVVSTTPDAHDSLANFLAELRRNRGDHPVPLPDPNQVVYRVYLTSMLLRQDTKNLSDERMTELVLELLGDVKWDRPTHFLKVMGNLVYVRQTLDVHRKIERLTPGLDRGGVICTSPTPVVGQKPHGPPSHGSPSRMR